MVDKSKTIILTCFLLLSEKLNVAFYYSQEQILPYNSDLEPISNSYNDTECIKSVLTSSRSKAFVSLYSSSGELKSFIFDINDKKNFADIHFNQYFRDNSCMMNYFGLNIYYYKFNGEIINSCLDTNGNILIEFYTDNLKIYHYKIIKKNKSPMYGYSILYSNFIGKYFFISEEEQFKLLNGDDDDFENIKK
jgi:hypothetical protein